MTMESENEMTETKVSENTAVAPERVETESERILRVEQDRVIDVTVRRAREQGYCNEVNRALAVVYPGVTGGFYDFSGVDCRGSTREQNERRAARQAEEARIYEEERRTRAAQRDVMRAVDRGDHVTTCWCGGEVHS
jgi:hypothetical protein